MEKRGHNLTYPLLPIVYQSIYSFLRFCLLLISFCVCVSLCKTSTKHNTWLWFGSLWIRKLSCNCCWCTKHRYFSKIMWSEVKSRNKFLTINKNNEVHLFDLNSFYIYFVFFFFFIFPSRSLSLSLSLSVLLFFCFPVFVCTNSSNCCIFGCCCCVDCIAMLSRKFFVQGKNSQAMHQPVAVGWNTQWTKFSGYWRNLRLMIQIIKTNSRTYS